MTTRKDKYGEDYMGQNTVRGIKTDIDISVDKVKTKVTDTMDGVKSFVNDIFGKN